MAPSADDHWTKSRHVKGKNQNICTGNAADGNTDGAANNSATANDNGKAKNNVGDNNNDASYEQLANLQTQFDDECTQANQSLLPTIKIHCGKHHRHY